MRKRAHETFDRIWKGRFLTRTDAYRWLAVQMGMPEVDCHMGMLSDDECQRVIDLSNAYLVARKVGRKVRKLRTNNRHT